MALELDSLRKAVASLERAVRVASEMIQGEVDTDHEEVIRAGVVQNFEFTYELCWKFMKRWLEVNGEGPAVDGVTRKELFRIAAERRLIQNVKAWFEYHLARNEATHVYDEQKARSVYAAALKFVFDAKDFLKTLEAKND